MVDRVGNRYYKCMPGEVNNELNVTLVRTAAAVPEHHGARAHTAASTTLQISNYRPLTVNSRGGIQPLTSRIPVPYLDPLLFGRAAPSACNMVTVHRLLCPQPVCGCRCLVIAHGQSQRGDIRQTTVHARRPLETIFTQELNGLMGLQEHCRRLRMTCTNMLHERRDLSSLPSCLDRLSDARKSLEEAQLCQLISRQLLHYCTKIPTWKGLQ